MGNIARQFRRNHNIHPKREPTERERKMLQALRSAAAVLKEYAKGENWVKTEKGMLWAGEGDGPDLAEMALGVKTAPRPEKQPEEGG